MKTPKIHISNGAPAREVLMPWKICDDGTVKMWGHFRVANTREPGKTYSTQRQKTVTVDGRPGSQTHKARVALAYAAWVAKMQGSSLTVWTLHNAIDEYIADGGARGKGVATSARSYLQHFDCTAGHIPIGRKLKLWWDKELTKLRRRCSQGGVNKYAAVLRAVLRHAELKDRIDSVPIKHWGIVSVPARDYSITREQYARLLESIDSHAPHLSMIVRFAARVPSRSGELRAMRRRHVDLFQQRIEVPALHNKGRRREFKPIPPELFDYFRALPLDPEFPVFNRFDGDGNPVPLGDFKRAWGWCRKDAGIPGLRFHDLRHMAVSDLADAGTPDSVIMQIAGWRTNMLTTYYHRDARALEQVRWMQRGESVANKNCADGEK